MFTLLLLGIQTDATEFDAPGVVLLILEQISSDEFLKIVPNSPGWQLQQLAVKMVTQPWRQAPLEQCAEDCLQVVLAALEELNKAKCSSAGEHAAIRKVHCSRRNISSSWVQALGSCNLGFSADIYSILAQSVIDRMLPLIGAQLVPVHERSENTVNVLKYTDLPLKEKQVLHYAAGYVPRKLLRQYSRAPNNKASQLFSDVVSTWVTQAGKSSDNDRVLADPITYWTHLQDRGGLLHCSPDFFHFMKVVEFHVQHTLNRQTLPRFAGKDIVTEVGNTVKAVDEVLCAFKKLLKEQVISEPLCEALLDQVLTCWISCKARQVTKQYVYDMKQARTGNTSRMGTPALRKTIDKQ